MNSGPTSPKPIRCGILGYGYMGTIRHKNLAEDPRYQLCSVFHTAPVELPDSIAVKDSWEAVVDDPNLDAVFVCLPNYMAKDAVVRAFEKGKHVFAEKPPGITVAETEAMIAAAAKSKRVLKFGFNHRYHPAIMKAKELVDSGRFGRLLWMRGRYGKSVDANFSDNWRAKKALAGGGILMDQGIHLLDLLLHFCPDFCEAKAFATNSYWKGEVEDNLFAVVRSPCGTLASLHSTMTQWRYLFSLEIFLEKGYVVINGLLSRSSRYGQEQIDYATERSPAPMATHSEVTSIVFNIDPSWQMESDEFAQAILEGKPITVGSPEDARRLMRLVTTIYDNATKPGSLFC